MMADVGRLTRVPLRDVWKHEAHDFTQWMEDNVDVLNDAIDLTLVNVEREKKTESSFSVDLIAEEEGGGRVVIENQLGRSDHDHLGKIITYLSHFEAFAAIWIVSDARPEHVASLIKLNEVGLARFYLLKIEAVRIGGSPPAPLISAVVEPAEKFAPLDEASGPQGSRHRLRIAWWSHLLNREDAKLHGHMTPHYGLYVNTAAGIRGLSYGISVTKESCAVELYIDRGQGSEITNRLIFSEIEKSRENIEAAFGEDLSWQNIHTKRHCRIRSKPVQGGYANPEEEWPEIQAQLLDKMNRLHAVIAPEIARLDMESIEGRAAQVSEEDEA